MTEHEPQPATTTRRNLLLFKLGAGFNAIAGALLAVPIIGFLVSSFTHHKTPQSWILLGPLDRFPDGQTRLATYRNPLTRPWDGPTADIPCWVRHVEKDQFQVFAVNCTHLGCPVRWFQESNLFLCPCHGGAYYANGDRASGPPPRGLFEYSYKVENNQLWVKGGILPTLSEPLG